MRRHRQLNRKRWERTRRAVFDAAGWRCEVCARPGRLECDHVIPLALGGDPWDMQNLQALCVECHRCKTISENRTRPPLAGLERWQVLTGKTP